MHRHGKLLRNSPEKTGPKRIPWRQKRAKSIPADGPAIGGGSRERNTYHLIAPAIGMITTGGGSSQHSQKIRNGQKWVGMRLPPTP